MGARTESPMPPTQDPPQPTDLGGGRCGSRPKLLAIGIAPLGLVSIGIVPMGVVSIGVVPMGVLSIGAVGMGLVNLCVVGMGVLVAGVNVMGVWWVGVEGMGLKRLAGAPVAIRQGQGHHPSSGSEPAKAMLFAYPTQTEAARKAKELGCSGVHAMGSLWMPCATHPSTSPGQEGPTASP